jgi:hypothetical protein
VEGKILYILNDDNQVLNRTAMYKIKPADFDRTHWPNFDVSMQALVMQAVEKLHERELPVNATNLRKELNFGDREWDKFRTAGLTFACFIFLILKWVVRIDFTAIYYLLWSHIRNHGGPILTLP